ncbi:glycoside hydrolase superfamily [Circinella umbellata]|nr:glycoside hydrolase superfamily [Circinella umbellata]
MFGRNKLFKITTAVSSVFLYCISQEHLLVSAGFPDGYNVVSYWGQNSAGSADSQASLAEYCDDISDILIIGFITNFNVGDLPSLNVANACEGTTFEGTALLQCEHIGKDIKTCQDKGKKVLLSLGGASGAYGFTNDDQGITFAKTMWDLFGAGDSNTRPFGDAVIDGFDLDIEGGGSTGYTAFVKELRNLFKKDSSKDYYITAAPQCPFPDAMLGEVLDEADIDAVNVQFYNNYCSTTSGSNFNFATWDEWAQNKAKNKNAKVFLGIPGSESAANTGYIPFDELKSVVDQVSSSYKKSFGGITIWDASQAYGNKDIEPNFASAVADLIHEKSGAPNDDDSDNNNDQKSTTTDKSTPTSTTTTSSDYTTTTTETTTATPTPSDDDNNHDDDDDDDDDNHDDDDDDDDNGEDNDPSCVQDGDSCSETGKYICTQDGFGVCVQDQWVVTPCAVGLKCLSTTDGGSIYCAQVDNEDGGGTCDAKSRRKRALSYINNPRPYKSARVTAQFLVTHIDKKKNQYNAIINARRLDTKAFGSKVIIEMKMPPSSNITVDSVTNGQVKQTDQVVKIQVNNPNRKSMALVFEIKGSIPDDDVFVAPDMSNMKFMT